MRLLWLILGMASLALGVIGAFVPLLPTVPLILLAAFSFSKSSENLHNWMLNHKVFGPWIDDWNTHGAISTRVKTYATVSIIIAFFIPIYMEMDLWIIITETVILTAVLVFIWSRPTA